MNSYYISQRISVGQNYRNLKPYRHLDGQEGIHALMTLGNSLMLYKILSYGLALQKSFSFACNIEKIEIIASPHHSSDIVWILDSLGRFGFWQPSQGFSIVSNHLFNDSSSSSLFQAPEDSVEVMSGFSLQSRQKDTEGTIFFTMQRTLVIIEVAVKKEGVVVGNIWKEKIAKQDSILFMEWVRDSLGDLFLGIIIGDKNGSTILQVYQLTSQQNILGQKPAWTFEKKNMLHFRSPQHGEILLITYDEVALHRYKQSHPLKCYRTKGNYGQGFCLNEGFYGHIGRELVIFSKDQLRSFSAFKFEDENIFERGGFIESNFLGVLENGFTFVGVITHRSQVYLVRILDKKCENLKQNLGLSSVSSLKPFEDRRGMFSMVGTFDDCHKVIISCLTFVSRIEREQKLPMVVDRLVPILGGGYAILSSGEANFVLRMTKNQNYQVYFDLPSGQLVSASGHVVILHNSIYEIDYQTQSYQTVIVDDILLAQVIDDDVYFLNAKGLIQQWNNRQNIISTIQEQCIFDYCWGQTLTTAALICASLSNPKEIRLASEEGIFYTPIKGHTLVSCLSSVALKERREYIRMGIPLGEQLLIGYTDGTVHLQSHSGNLIRSFQLLCSNFIMFERKGPNEMFLSCGTRHFLMKYSHQGCQLKRIQLTVSQSLVTDVSYLSKFKTIIFIEQLDQSQILSQSEACFENSIPNLSVIHESKSLPYILNNLNSTIIASGSQILQYCVSSRKIVRQSRLTMEIKGIEAIDKGYLVLGYNQTKVETLVVLNQDLQIIQVQRLNAAGPTKLIKAIKGTNDFFRFSDTEVSLHRIERFGHITLLLGSQLPMQTNSAAINSQTSQFILNDPNRYVSVYQYQHNICHVANLLPSYTITVAAFVGQAIMVGDERGYITIYGIDRQKSVANRSIWMREGSCNLGEVIECVQPGEQVATLMGEEGSIYQLRTIEREDFDILHRLQESILKVQNQQKCFTYSQWRSKVQSDKVIDGTFLQMLVRDEKYPLVAELQTEKYVTLLDRLLL